MIKTIKLLTILLLSLSLAGCKTNDVPELPFDNNEVVIDTNLSDSVIPDVSVEEDKQVYLASNYTGEPFAVINNNVPFFTEEEINTDEFEIYSVRDELDRCGVAFANVSPKTLPTEQRGSISNVKPSGWHTIRYDDLISDKYLYNRCHLIAFSLAGENANKDNLITGTRYLNVEGMLPFEMEVLNYVKNTGNHVLYRVTPMFENDDLVAQGVLMEAFSVEDDGEGVKFNVFVYNVQPGVKIDYHTGDSERA